VTQKSHRHQPFIAQKTGSRSLAGIVLEVLPRVEKSARTWLEQRFMEGKVQKSNVYGERAMNREEREELVRRLIDQFGEFKKVVRMTTGEAFKVPTRDIIEKGIREQDLDQYPKWED